LRILAWVRRGHWAAIAIIGRSLVRRRGILVLLLIHLILLLLVLRLLILLLGLRLWLILRLLTLLC
jgi:hypothetical protein